MLYSSIGNSRLISCKITQCCKLSNIVYETPTVTLSSAFSNMHKYGVFNHVVSYIMYLNFPMHVKKKTVLELRPLLNELWPLLISTGKNISFVLYALVDYMSCWHMLGRMLNFRLDLVCIKNCSFSLMFKSGTFPVLRFVFRNKWRNKLYLLVVHYLRIKIPNIYEFSTECHLYTSFIKVYLYFVVIYQKCNCL